MEKGSAYIMNYRKDIDGLRAIAVLAVIFYHAKFAFMPGGYIGVDVFFVISGFLITGIIYKEIKNDSFSFLNFYYRRIRRIFPALFVVCMATIPFALWLLTQDELKQFSMSLIGTAGSFSNIIFWLEAGYFDTASDYKPLLHTWSLGIEEQFYFVFPAILLSLYAFKKHSIKILIGIILLFSLIFSEYLSRYYPDANFYLLPTRIWELMAGALVAIYLIDNPNLSLSLLSKNIISIICFILIILSLCIFTDSVRFPSFYAIIPITSTAILIAVGSNETIITRLLSINILSIIGLSSYSIYLWHQPVLVFMRHFTGQAELTFIITIYCILLSLLLGFLSYRFIETPFRNKNFLSIIQVYWAGILSMVFLLLIGISLLIYANNYYGYNNPAIKKINDYSVNLQENYRNCKNSIHSFCQIGDNNILPNILMWGDSHGGSIAVGMDKILNQNNLSAYLLTLGGCPPLIDKSRLIDGVADLKCMNKIKDFKENFTKIENQIDTVILSMRWSRHLNPSDFDNLEGGVEKLGAKVQIYDINDETKKTLSAKDVAKAIEETVTFFQNNRMKVVIVYPIPEMGWHIPKKLIGQIRNKQIPDASINYSIFTKYNAYPYEVLDSLKNVLRVYPENILCNSYLPNRCAAITHEGIPLYFDDDHPSPYAAEKISKEIVKFLD